MTTLLMNISTNNRLSCVRRLLMAVSCLLLLGACARMGQPDGGWYDDTPPQITHTSPAEKAVGVPQLEMPDIKTSGKRIIVALKDTLKERTTYTIDFSDAITDNNEGNPMGNYTYCFSTGTEIDTLEVSGTVLDAENLEPVKGILVGLYSHLADSAFTTEPRQRAARAAGGRQARTLHHPRGGTRHLPLLCA